jgi:hypothetical protein
MPFSLQSLKVSKKNPGEILHEVFIKCGMQKVAMEGET